MASNKRQRKKSNQAARRAALEAARKRQQRKKQVLSFGALAAGVLLLALLIVLIASRGDDESAAGPTTTTAAPGSTSPTASSTQCPKPTDQERITVFKDPPPMCIDPAKAYRAVFTTSAGVVKVDLDTKRAPIATNNFVVLARYHYYDGSSFHRTDPSIDIIQGGSPNTNTISDPGPGYNIKDDPGKFTYSEGDLVMARSSGPDSAGGQYFFAAGPKTESLGSQGTYVTFGKVSEGLDVLKKVLASHKPCPEDPAKEGSCLGGAPDPPVKVETITIEES